MSIKLFRELVTCGLFQPVTPLGNVLVNVTPQNAITAAEQSSSDGQPIFVTVVFERKIAILSSIPDASLDTEAVR